MGRPSREGSPDSGTLFSLHTDGTDFATLHSFTARKPNPSGIYTNADGDLPVGNLVLSGSLLYGTTEAGGAHGYGMVFALDLEVVPPAIHIQFTASPTNGVPPLPVHFLSLAVDADGNAVRSWNWNFGDGSSSLSQNPSHTYTNAGTFFPILTCINNDDRTVTGNGPAIAATYPSSILNGGFETRSFTNWTLSGQSQSVLTSSKYAYTGTYGAGLYSPQGGFLSQTLSTAPGRVYLISFWLDYTAVLKTPNDFQVAWNGNVLLDKTNLTATGWTNIQLTVTATTSNSTLQFHYQKGSFYFGLDDVSVLPVAQLVISGSHLSGADLVLNATGGLSGRIYNLLTGTNLTEPLNQWTSTSTSVADSDGNVSITATNAVNVNFSQRCYILELQ
ncbi:MAG: PKD domain-containing protein [Pedosphaera sp.]|nr:PKD domain-containing protein [Pedosphaera sp.]